jgi:hypothetical protein
MRKIAVLVAAVALVAVIAGTAEASSGLTMFSGRTLERGMALNFSVGAPDASFTFAGALMKNLDLGGVLRLGYLTPIGFGAGGFWMGLAATLRYSILDRSAFNLAIRADLGPVFNLVGGAGYGKVSDFMGGFTLAPYVLVGVPLKDIVSLNFGFGLPIMALFASDVSLAGIPIAFAFGTEVFIQSNLTFNFLGELGPGIWVCSVGGASVNSVGFYGLFKVGISYGF